MSWTKARWVVVSCWQLIEGIVEAYKRSTINEGVRGVMDKDQVEIELIGLKRRQLILWWTLSCVVIGFAIVFTVQANAIRKLAHPESLSLRHLDIVDEHGTPRVILASPAPPPTFFGKVGKRDGPVSGILLADATGTERGGYVTGDDQEANALLTLDAQGSQTVLLLAEPDGSTLFRLWNKDKGSVLMGVSESSPFLNVRKDKAIFLSAPKGNPETRDLRPLFK